MHPCLTFDPKPKELAHRDSGQAHVSLLWSPRTHRAAVVLYDDETGQSVELEIHTGENPLELYEHAFAYADTRGRPGSDRSSRST
ncbi:MAG TPA: hypothetical protein VJ986_14190 [Gaiellaceae bacterium]|nr:hypothetical protein [Gaiellaceae bacterium]